MAGVPVDDLTPYLAALVERGNRVAIADQRDDDADDISREITRVVTPGTMLESTGAEAYLAAVVRDDDWGLAFVDVTTGQFHVTDAASEADAFTELHRFAPEEVLTGPDLRSDDAFLTALRDRTAATLTLHEAGAFAPGKATHEVREQFGDGALDSLGVERESAAVRAAGAAIGYVADTDAGVLASLTRLQPYRADDHVELDATTQRNLELTATMAGEGDGSLFDTIDHTVSAAGGRRLESWLLRAPAGPRRTRPPAGRSGRARRRAARAGCPARVPRRDVRPRTPRSRTAGGRADATDLLRIRRTLALLPGSRTR